MLIDCVNNKLVRFFELKCILKLIFNFFSKCCSKSIQIFEILIANCIKMHFNSTTPFFLSAFETKRILDFANFCQFVFKIETQTKLAQVKSLNFLKQCLEFLVGHFHFFWFFMTFLTELSELNPSKVKMDCQTSYSILNIDFETYFLFKSKDLISFFFKCIIFFCFFFISFLRNFFYLNFLNKVETQKSKGGADDKGTTISNLMMVVVIDILVFFGFFFPSSWFARDQNETNQLEAIIAVILMIFGFILRASAMNELGSFFSKTLVVQESQKVIQSGLYSIVRHPGYAANMFGKKT